MQIEVEDQDELQQIVLTMARSALQAEAAADRIEAAAARLEAALAPREVSAHPPESIRDDLIREKPDR